MTSFPKNFSALLFFSALISFIGCDNNPTVSTNDLIGTWTLTKLTVSGTTVLTPEQANLHITIVINTDGTYKTTVIDKSGTTVDNGTWTVSNGTVSIKHQDGTVENSAYTVSGNKLTLASTQKDSTGATIPVLLEFTKQ